MPTRDGFFDITDGGKLFGAPYRENWKDQAAINKAFHGNRIIGAASFEVTAAAGLFINVSSGEAVIGRHIHKTTATTGVAFPPSVTRWVWLKQATAYDIALGAITDTAINVEFTATADPPAGEVSRLAKVTADGSGITAVEDLRSFGNIWEDEDIYNMAGGLLTITDTEFEKNVTASLIERIVEKTANYTIGAFESNIVWSNAGAGGQVILTLTGSPNNGMTVSVFVATAQNLRVLASGGFGIQMGPSLSAADGYVECATVGGFIKLVFYSDQGKWVAEGHPSGQWFMETAASAALADLGQILFPALDAIGTDASLVEAAAGSFNAMLFSPMFNIPLRYVAVCKGNADAAESMQAAFYGPVARPVRGSRVITPSTDSPVLLAKSADTVAPSALGLAACDVGGAATNMIAGRSYWAVWQNEEAMNVLRLTIRAIGPGLAAGVMTTAQQLMFIATAGAPAYATNFGTVGVATLAGITWNANTTSMPVLGIY